MSDFALNNAAISFSKPIVQMPSADTKNMKAIEKAAEEFEAMFVAEMLRPMFETIESDEMFGGGQAEETWRGLLIDEYGKSIAKAGGIGLADHVKAAMIQMQEYTKG